MPDLLLEHLEQSFREFAPKIAHLPRPISSVDARSDGSSIDVVLDTDESDYSEWIDGDGADIGLHRSQDTNRVTGAHLPLYARTLVVGGDKLPTMWINLDAGTIEVENVREFCAHVMELGNGQPAPQDVP